MHYTQIARESKIQHHKRTKRVQSILFKLYLNGKKKKKDHGIITVYFSVV